MAILDKIKDKWKKISRPKNAPEIKTGLPAAAPSVKDPKKDILGAQELAVEKAKFSHPQPSSPAPRRALPDELPAAYGRDRMALLVRDSWWLYTYWEIGPGTLEKLKDSFGEQVYKARRVLRVYEVSGTNFDGKNANSFFDIQVNDYANNWYINAAPAKSWCVDLGLLLSEGRFVTILRSNIVATPLDGPSWITDEEWMVPEDMFARLYGMGFGFGKSSPGKAWQEKIKQALFSGALSSAGIASMASPAKKAPPESFRLNAFTELIVYGATEAGAKLSVQGRPVALRPDGTFTLRFALSDGKQAINIKAVSADGKHSRGITPIVTRETK